MILTSSRIHRPGQQHNVSKLDSSKELLASVPGTCEINNHADTCCLGRNFVPVYFTGKVCEVTGYMEELPCQNNIEICTGATAYDTEFGDTVILIINEALWFGDRMRHSLINPNQVRSFG